MITENSTGYKAFTATAVALEQGVRVVLGSGGTISVASDSDIGIGVTTTAIAASGTGNIKLWGAPGTFMMQAAGPVTLGAALYAATAGECDDTGTYALGMVAIDAAGAQGDLIECAKFLGGTAATAPYSAGDIAAVVALGTNFATAVAMTKQFNTISGESNCGVILPTAAAGLIVEVYNSSANTLKIYPASGDAIGGAAVDAVDTIATHTMARFVAVDATTWAMTGCS